MKGSIQVLNAIMVFIVVSFLIGVFNIHKILTDEFSFQNKKDAHMLSVVGMYVDVLDEVSWANKQLQRISILSAAIVFAPELAPFIKYVEILCVGLEKYQDFLLTKIKIEAPVIDLKLRTENGLNLILDLHYLTYRRSPGIDLLFIKIPGLIEFNKSIYESTCVSHSSFFVNTKTCLKNDKYKDEDWFAPTSSDWGVKIVN